MQTDVPLARLTPDPTTGATTDAHGKAIRAAPVTIKARVNPTTKLLKMAGGREVQASHRLYTAAQIGVGDLATIEGKPWEVLTVAAHYNLDGVTVLVREVFL